MGNILCIDVLVLSEFINRFLRIEYENHIKASGLDKNKFDFKQFRSMSEGIQASQDVEMVVKGLSPYLLSYLFVLFVPIFLAVPIFYAIFSVVD